MDFTGQKDLVALPRPIYTEFLAWQKMIKSRKTFKPTKSELVELARARKDFATGKTITLEQLISDLGSSR